VIRINTQHARVFGNGPQVVYGYTLESYEGLIKIGHTTSGDYVKRIRDQNTTGMPGRPVVRFAYFTENSQAVEAAVHRRFAQYRLPGKEWFRLTAEQVLEGFDEFVVAIRGKAEAERQKVEAEALARARIEEQRRQEAAEQARRQAVEAAERAQKGIANDLEVLRRLEDPGIRRWLKNGGPPWWGARRAARVAIVMTLMPASLFLGGALLVPLTKLQVLVDTDLTFWPVWIALALGFLILLPSLVLAGHLIRDQKQAAAWRPLEQQARQAHDLAAAVMQNPTLYPPQAALLQKLDYRPEHTKPLKPGAATFLANYPAKAGNAGHGTRPDVPPTAPGLSWRLSPLTKVQP
jgi:hypothetical protein